MFYLIDESVCGSLSAAHDDMLPLPRAVLWVGVGGEAVQPLRLPQRERGIQRATGELRPGPRPQ